MNINHAWYSYEGVTRVEPRSRVRPQKLAAAGTIFLCLLFAVISIRGRVPRILLYRLGLGLHAVHLAREVARDGEVERSRMERYVAPAKPRPAVPCLVDPPDLIEVTHILERAEIRSLWRRIVEHGTRHNGDPRQGWPTYPFRGLDRDKTVIRAFPFENDRVWPPATYV